MGLTGRLVFGGIVAGAALAYYVQRRHAQTGMGYLDVIAQLPSDAQRWAAKTRTAALTAIEDGRAAARARETELTRQLEAASPAGAS